MRTRRSVVLLLVLTCVALTATLLTPLAAMSGSEAVTASLRGESLRHRLAGDSLLAALPSWLKRNPELARQVERTGSVLLTVDFAGIQVRARVEEDSAKLPLAMLPAEPESRVRVLAALAAAGGLGSPPVSARRGAPRCIDDLFESATDRDLFGTRDEAGWSHVLTSFGTRVNARHASAAVLDAALSEIKSGIGAEFVRKRNLDPEATLEQLLGSLELNAPQRRIALKHLDMRIERYSLFLETTIDGDRRYRYVIVSADAPQRVLSDWEIAP